MNFFTEKDRQAMSDRVLGMAKSDERVSGGAFVGSFANGEPDQWSDLDMTFGIKKQYVPLAVLNDWMENLSGDCKVIHHFDVIRETAIYRVILFVNGMELDLSVVPEKDYRPVSAGFRLLFGNVNERKDTPPPDMDLLIGWSWHQVLHANSAIRRSRFWQAEFVINNLRNHVITLKCIRLGLPAVFARGVDKLPKEDKEPLEKSFAGGLNEKELKKALINLTGIFLNELDLSNKKLSAQLRTMLGAALGHSYIVSGTEK